MDDITCLMLFYGRKEVAEESMESFLRQTYPHKKLLIVNTHPDPVWFDKEYPNVEVHNVNPDTFSNLNEKYNYALAGVKTKWWTPWDSDDLWLPWHLENLAGHIKNTKLNGVPRKIGLQRSYFMIGKKQKINMGWNMWSTSIWETLDKNGNHHSQCDIDKTTNCDRQILYLNWDRYWLDRGGSKSRPSYIYRFDVVKNHNRSALLGEAGMKRAKKLNDNLSRVQLLESWKPNWKIDYIEKTKGEHETYADI